MKLFHIFPSSTAHTYHNFKARWERSQPFTLYYLIELEFKRSNLYNTFHITAATKIIYWIIKRNFSRKEKWVCHFLAVIKSFWQVWTSSRKLTFILFKIDKIVTVLILFKNSRQSVNCPCEGYFYSNQQHPRPLFRVDYTFFRINPASEMCRLGGNFRTLSGIRFTRNRRILIVIKSFIRSTWRTRINVIFSLLNLKLYYYLIDTYYFFV